MTITETNAPATAGPDAVEAAVDRLFAAVLGAQEVQAVYLGHRLGWYDALAAGDPLTAGELATRTGSDQRYAREWLEHQAVCGYLTVDDVTAAPEDRRFNLPAGWAEVLTDVESPAFVAPLARFVGAVGHHLDSIADAYRTGGGVGWAELGDEAREAQAAANRPLFLHQLPDLFAQDEDLDRRLREGTCVADVGTGHGWSAIGIALAHPHLRVDGFDIDGPSIEAARRNAERAGVADRVRFHLADVGDLAATTRYDAVFAFECIHDLADPVSVLSTMRRLAGPDGAVVVMDENTGERFEAPGSEVERLLYGYSLTCCLPDGRSHDHSVATGTVMRPDTLAAYARRAGFDHVDVLGIDHDFFRFYRLGQ